MEREKETDADARDRKKELEEFERIKRRILDEDNSDAEEEIEKVIWLLTSVFYINTAKKETSH